MDRVAGGADRDAPEHPRSDDPWAGFAGVLERDVVPDHEVVGAPGVHVPVLGYVEVLIEEACEEGAALAIVVRFIGEFDDPFGLLERARQRLDPRLVRVRANEGPDVALGRCLRVRPRVEVGLRIRLHLCQIVRAENVIGAKLFTQGRRHR